MSIPTKLLAIFKPGTHISAAGAELTFSEADISATAAAYDPALHKAPLVIGHPKDNTPAYGWTKGLSVADGLLQAAPDAVNAQFAEWVNAGHYKKISAAFYPPASPVNPVPGVFYLRHIGFLGGQPPAVKGLPEPEFADGGGEAVMFAFADNDIDFITLEFTEENPAMTVATEEERLHLAAEVAKFEKDKADFAGQQAAFAEQQKALAAQAVEIEAQKLLAKKREHTEFAEAQIKAGRLLPKDKLAAVEFMAALSAENVLEFGEGETVTKTKPLEWFKGFLLGLPAQVDFKERTGNEGKAMEFAENPRAIADAATEYQEAQQKLGRQVDDVAAVQFVLANRS